MHFAVHMSRIGSRLSCVAAVMIGCLAPGGCATDFVVPGFGGPGGSVRLQSLDDSPVALSSRFETAVFRINPAETAVYLSDVPLERLLSGDIRNGQVTHVELLWNPRPGATPMARSATNASIRHIVFADGEVGVYGGAGFIRPRGRVDGDTISLHVQDASLRLLHSTPGFNDLLSPARLNGSFTATQAPRQTQQVQFIVSQLVTNALGRSMFVQLQLGDEPVRLAAVAD